MIHTTEEKELLENHKGTFKRLLFIISYDNKLLKSWQLWSSIVLSIVGIAYLLINDVDVYCILGEIISNIISIFPSVLGFNLGAYALLAGLGSDKLREELAEDTGHKYTTYQEISSVFAWSILIQALALIVSFIISIIISFEIQSKYANIINVIALGGIGFLALYAILLIYRIVLNVFSFSQAAHFLTITKPDKN